MASFFVGDWFLCTGQTTDCTGGSTNVREISIADDDLSVGLPKLKVNFPPPTGGPVGHGFYCVSPDPVGNLIYFNEPLADGMILYVGHVTRHVDPNTTSVVGKRRRVDLNGATVPFAAGEEDWTSNRPVQ